MCPHEVCTHTRIILYTLPIKVFCLCWLTPGDPRCHFFSVSFHPHEMISHLTSYLSHLSAFVLVSFIISAVNTSAIAAAQCEVPALKESHSNVRCARLKNLTLLSCWMTHKVKVAQGIDKMSFNSQPGNTWSSSQFWNIKMLNVKIL